MSVDALQAAADLCKVLGDAPRLQLLQLLTSGEWCVTEIVTALGEKFSTVSQRLRMLRTEGLVKRRRAGNHLFYALSDRHVADLVQNALAHADELQSGSARFIPGDQQGRRNPMTTSSTHANHNHQHGPGCGHTAIKHDGHVDYLHDGHLHHVKGKDVEEHKLAVGKQNPGECTPKHACGGHDKTHKHGPGCGHEAVPHGDHTDYLVEGHLHHPHGGHCDDHGQVQRA